MPPHDRAVHNLGHLALALAGACLAVANFEYLPEIGVMLVVYLGLVYLSWRLAGRRRLSNWLGNVLGLAIVAGAVGWVYLRLRAPYEGIMWFENVALHAVLVPFLGPILMALLAVRLFQPRGPGDFWVLQGLGLLQVALGCVLANQTLFAPLLLGYLVVGLCALAARERQVQARRSAPVSGAPALPRPRWALFGALWGLAAAVLALPLFLVTPRSDRPEWRPLDQFAVRPAGTKRAKTGFSDEIDLKRTGTLEIDDAVAFTVRVTDASGQPVQRLPGDQRWRGAVLDRYEAGTWTSELAWPSGGPVFRWSAAPRARVAALELAFKVPSRAGGLFLADPVQLGDQPGDLPVRTAGAHRGPLFFESGGTVLALTNLVDEEYRYTQVLGPGPRDRTPAPRLRDGYLLRLLRVRPPGLTAWAQDLLRRLAQRSGDRDLLTEVTRPRPEWEAIPPKYWEAIGRLLSDHLARSGEYEYSLRREPGSDEDPVVDFLTYSRHGACEQFASALALLLRAVGVPARIVKGYRGADYQGDGTYAVRQSHAHAWVEALVAAPGSGPIAYEWLSLDPTPEGEGLDSGRSALARWWQQQQRTGRELWEELIVGYNSAQQAGLWERLASPGWWLRLAPWAAVALSALLVVALVRRMGRRSRGRAPGARSLYRRLCAALARVGVVPGTGETPGELAARAEQHLGGAPATADLAGVPARVVRLYYLERFGGEKAGPDDLLEAAAGVERLGRALA